MIKALVLTHQCFYLSYINNVILLITARAATLTSTSIAAALVPVAFDEIKVSHIAEGCYHNDKEYDAYKIHNIELKTKYVKNAIM